MARWDAGCNTAVLYATREEDDAQSRLGAWRKRAACWDIPAWDMFDSSTEGTRRALEVCKGCPVILKCREYALRYREEYGVWGGMTPHDRRAYLRMTLGVWAGR